MDHPQTFIVISGVELNPTDRELVGEIEFNANGAVHRDCADLVRDGKGRLSVSWRDKDGVRVLDSEYAHPLDALAFREIERQIIAVLRGREMA